MPLLSVKHLNKSFGDFRAVDDVSFEVEANKVFGLLGLNGAGKSTTLRCLLSLATPDHGTIEIFGKKLHENRSEILRQIGCIIERPDHYGYLSADENLRMHALGYGKKLNAAKRSSWLEQVGLAGKGKQKVKTFSQGMKQRLAIACALAHEPELVILDEPTNGLDPQGILDLREWILRLKNEFCKTVIVSSHLLSEVEEIADEVAILHKGKLMVTGSTQQLLSDTERVVTIETNDAQGLIKQLSSGDWGGRCQRKSEKVLNISITTEELLELNKAIMQTGFPVYQLNSRKKLEDYFMNLTQGHA